MAEIKWIKIDVGLFDNRKMKQLQIMPNGESLMLIWLRLLLMAGTTNDDGYIYFTDTKPYTAKMLAVEFNKPESLIQEALDTFDDMGMIMLDNGFIRIKNWETYQNVDGMDRVREKTRKRVAEYRERKKLEGCNVTGRYSVTLRNATEEEREEEKEKKEEVEKKKKKPLKQQQLEILESILPEFPSLSEELINTLKEWVKYKAEIKKTYSDTGMKVFVKKVANNEMAYGTNKLIETIEYSMSNSYQGVVWDRLNDPKKGFNHKGNMLNDLADLTGGQ